MKYSIIIPVYNASKTLHRCLDSLLAVQYKDAEFILVNDGSSDSSGEICEEYALRHSNIKYIAKENGGVSSARNAGLDVACGDYILFVDSDDYVASEFFSILDQTLEKTPYDLVQFSCCIDNGNEKKEIRRMPVTAAGREQIMPYLVNAICRKTLNPPWAKLYRRDLIEKNHVRFPEGASVAEDRVFNIKYSLSIESYAVSDQILYFVSTENENSLTRGRQKNLKKQFEITGAYFQEALSASSIPESEKEQYRKAVNFGDCRTIYHEAKLMHQDHVRWFARQKRLGHICDEINRKHMKYPKTRYCTLIMLPVRLRLTPVIDAVAWKLTH